MSTSVNHKMTKTNDGGKVVRRERAYDHLYDPVYTVSSEADHARANVKAFTSKNRIRKMPEFASMFSDQPRFTVKLDPVQPVPAFIDHQWRGHTEQRKEVLLQLAGLNPNAEAWLRRKECHVTGADNWKYFKRPLIPFAQQLGPDVIFALPKEDLVTVKKVVQQPTHVTVGVQTDYRENETQTDPYSPEYVVQPGTTASKLLQLAPLSWGRGLPAGLAEVEMIERTRAKQAWEARLPPLSDLSQLDKRRRMVVEMKAKEWAFREGEIQKLQEARLAVLKDQLKQRDEAQKDVTNERLKQIYYKHQKVKETKMEKIQNDYARSLRRLEAKRRNVEGKLERRSFDSRIYSLQTHTNKNTSNNELKSCYLDTYEGLLELEASLNASVHKSAVRRPKSKIIKPVIKPPVDKAMELLEKYRGLREEVNKQKALRFPVKKEKPVPRPVTPTVEKPPEGDEESELAVIHLQKVLRGRSVQYEMFKGKEKHLDLIQELRSVHALQEDGQKQHKADEDLIMNLKKQKDNQRHKICREEASQASVVDAELGQLFDTWSKELIRLQEERRIHAFTLLAERERRIREAEESGRRQAEERRLREEDEIFKQVVQVHQESVDLYLEDIILGTLDQVAEQQAREEIHKRAKEVNDVAYAMEESRNNLQSEEIVSELVYSFLIPEGQKTSFRQRVHQKQHRHLLAAQSIIQGTSGILPSTPGASQLTCPGIKASSQVVEEMISQVEQGKEAEQDHTQPEERQS
ncbi:cilia- and flagella-associated protein 91 [Amphiprion ocellaris]|uniref:Cilia- and flagella-associated protein 91 n=1 Tax=Amphiprion ocellaris TaxID=80972 RepID=A0A3Q1B2G7_AMPOC|nr:cilia- and flagella-associated protein 91 [Amphiprion ocellaris]